MVEELDYIWRVCATGMCFAIFGIGGLAVGFVVFPLLSLFAPARAVRRVRARQVIHVLFRAFVRLMRGLGVLSYEVHGLERLQRSGRLMLANHPSLIDVVFLMSFVRNADCVVKGALVRNPFTRGAVLTADFLRNTDGPGLVEDAIDSVRSGSNLVIFPEGTRTPLSGPLQMRRGAANIAVRGRIDITPIVIRCTPPVLAKGMKWWRPPKARAHFVIDVREDIAIAPFVEPATSEAIAARRVTRYLLDYYSGEMLRANA